MLHQLEYIGTHYPWTRRLISFLLDKRQPIIEKSICENKLKFKISSFQELSRLKKIEEIHIVSDVCNGIEEDEVFYDIGCNIGLYLCTISMFLESGTVIGFDPISENISRARENLELNEQKGWLFDIALSDSNTRDELDLASHLKGSPLGYGGHILSSVANNSSRQKDTTNINIETRTGDYFISQNDLPTPNIIKIDVDGAEYRVLNGLKDTLVNDECRLVYCEIHPDRLEDADISVSDIDKLFETHGFTQKREVEIREGRPPMLRYSK